MTPHDAIDVPSRLRTRLLPLLGALALAAAPALLAAPAEKAKASTAATPAKTAKSAKSAKAKPAPAAAAKAGLSLEAGQLAALKPRPIGPALMGGRVSDIALDPEDPATWYVGLATGGVWKTSNHGATFAPIFDEETTASIGAVAVAPSDPRVLWVGTGEANDRNSSGWGDGVYRSTDGGATWTNVGLKGSRSIARIVVHPKDPATAWVAAVGDLWTSGGERGLFETKDGGKTWKKVLGVEGPEAGKVGCGDVALDPSSPDTLYTALYARQRTPWSFAYGASFTDGKDLGGIFRSTDGGATWKKLTKGLPGLTGRIGLSVSASRPGVVMAVVQSDEGGTSDIDDPMSRAGGVFRSEDGGESWTRTSRMNPRPFYFSQIRVDPKNDQRVYLLGYMLQVSDDGGKTFREDLFQKVHPDCHALVVAGNPIPKRKPEPREGAGEKEPEPDRPPVSPRLLLGTDGGAYESWDAGKTWLHVDKIPSGQFYRINVDDSTPFRICGGLQDNTNWVGPSRTYSKDGIVNADWTNIGGGDGFYCVFDPFDRNVVYAESQEGELHRFDMRTGEVKLLRPAPTEGQPRFRFHWNAPLIGSRHAKGTLYLGGNHVFRLADKAERWEPISPDLSTRDLTKMVTVGSGAENYGVVYTLAESPLAAGLLWAGTDDGKLWITEDDGGRWTDLTGFLPAAAKGQWIGRIEAGRHDAKVAYLAVAAYRTGDFAPHAWRTADGGKSWQSITGNLPAGTPVTLVREDPVNPDLLYAGTYTGLWVSLDRGGSWTKWKGLPTVEVDDVLVHERDHALVVATHGRSLYVVDDVSPLQQLTAQVAAKDDHLFAPLPAFGRYLLPGWEDSAGKGDYRGENPAGEALITFWVKAFTGDPVKVAISNEAGQPVANLEAPGTPGLGRVSWDLRPTKDVLTQYGGLGAKKLLPSGTYTVTLSHGKAEEAKEEARTEAKEKAAGTPSGPPREKQKLKVTIAEGIETR